MFTSWNLPFPRVPPSIVHITKLPSFTKPAKATRNARPPWVDRGETRNLRHKTYQSWDSWAFCWFKDSFCIKFFAVLMKILVIPFLAPGFSSRLSRQDFLGCSLLELQESCKCWWTILERPNGGPLQFWERRLVIHKKLCYFLAGFFEAKKDEPGTQK